MQGFPADREHQVSLANWRQAPWSAWAFHHVRELIPTAEIRHNPSDRWSLEEAPVNLGGISIDLDRSGVMSIAGFIDAMQVDAMLVLHRDRIIYESYHHGMDQYQPHILFSVSKSLLGLVCAVLARQQQIDLTHTVSFYIPELKSTAYCDVTLRQLLDMQAPVSFDEDYQATEGLIVDYRKATGWNPPDADDKPADLRSFFHLITDTVVDHEGQFSYASPNTDLLAWIIERVCGRAYATVVSDLLWQPLGAETSAYITVDRLGAPRAAGGLCTTLRDLARVGRLIANDGKRDGKQILPHDWTKSLIESGDVDAWQRGAFASRYEDIPVSYRDQWFVAHPHPADESHWTMAHGIHGQDMLVDADNDFVMVMFASNPQAQSASGPLHSLLAARAIRDYLVNHF